MILDGALADVQVRGDVLAMVARKHQRHDLALSRRQSGNTGGRGFPPPEQFA
jgi:hypothetical protein